MANTKVTGDLIASGTITAANLVSGTLDTLLNSYLTTNTYATQGYVTTAVNNLIAAAPASLDTLNELAAALNDDANFATTVTNSLATKLNLSGGTLSGDITISKGTLDQVGVSFLNYTDVNPYTASINLNTSGQMQIHGSNGTKFTGGLYYFDHMTLDSTGNLSLGGKISIGTSSTVRKFNIDGGSISTDTPTIRISSTDSSGTNKFGIEFYSNNGADVRGKILADNNGRVYIDDNGGGGVVLQANGGSGNVGIGTSTPTSGKLEIQTGATAAGLWVQTGGTTDAYTVADFRTGTNAPALVVKGNANVGIGTTSPSAKLDVQGSGALLMTRTSSGLATYIENDGGYAAQYMYQIGGNPRIVLHTNGNSYFNGGNVGIGTTTPATLLTTVGSAYSVSNSGRSIGGILVYADSGGVGGYGGAISFGTGGLGSSAIAAVSGPGSDRDVNGLAFFTHGSSSGLADSSEAMRIQYDGNVGIGTTSPSGKLDIQTSGGTFSFDSNDQDFSRSPIILRNDTDVINQVGNGIVWTRPSGRKVSAITNYFYGDSDQSGLNFYVQETSSGSIATLKEAMRIDNAGNVGIGTIVPSKKLEVWSPSTVESSIRIRQSGYNYWDLKSPASDVDFTISSVDGEKLRVHTLGGISFNGDTAAANALDDYEEGTWTPSMNGYSGVTYSQQTGHYTKIGRLVKLTFIMTITNIGTYTGNSHIGGVPFNSGTTATLATGGYLNLMTALNVARSDQFASFYNGGSALFIYSSTGSAYNGNHHKSGSYSGTIVYFTS